MKEVYETIKALRGDEDKTYEYMDKVRTSKEESLRNAPLHYSRGTYLADKEGKNVLEFDMKGGEVMVVKFFVQKDNDGNEINSWYYETWKKVKMPNAYPKDLVR